MDKIDPANVTNHNRSATELQQFILFCVLVAGKNSNVQAEKLHHFLKDVTMPFTFMLGLRNLQALRSHMEHCKLGQYTRLEKTFGKLLDAYQDNPYFLRTVSVEDLEKMVGMKTARFFLVHSRPNVNAAILDTHILAWLADQGHDVPKATPSSKKEYKRVEEIFLSEAVKRGQSIAELDLDIWRSRRKDVEHVH